MGEHPKSHRDRGAMGGRPPKNFSYVDAQKKLQDAARKRGTTLLPLVIDLWEGILKGRIKCSVDVRERVAARVAGKFGLPDKTSLDVSGSLPVKMFDMTGWTPPVTDEGDGPTPPG